MNKLWVRLSLAFAVVIVVGILGAALLANWRVNDQFRRFVADNFKDNPVLNDALVDYYARNQSWAGVETTFEALRFTRASRGDRPPRFRGPIPKFVLTDTDGNIVYDLDGNGPNRLNPRELDEAAPIEAEGQIIGHLLVKPPDRGNLSLAAISFLGQVTQSLLLAGLVAGGLGIILGLVIARGLTSPLRQLGVAARRISQGTFGEQVRVEGAQEVADLAVAFNDMSRTLEEGERLRRNLIADVAHELRTPLSVLQGNLRAMLDDVYAMDKTEIARLFDQTRLLHRLINDLHELAQAEAHQLPLNRSPMDLTRLVTDTAETFSHIAETEGVILETNLADIIPPVDADHARISQVLHNLLTNSLRHTPAGGTITIDLSARSDTINLSVSDTGEGIPAEHLPHIFDRFYRTDPARTRDKGGAGLGLAIARAIIEAHGGQIGVTSDGTPGHGSTFTLQLPVSG